MNHCTAAPCTESALACSSVRIEATASNSTEGDPASWPSALSVPPLTLIPPTLGATRNGVPPAPSRSEEHTSELQSLMRISYAVFCLKTKKESGSTNTQHAATHRP